MLYGFIHLILDHITSVRYLINKDIIKILKLLEILNICLGFYIKKIQFEFLNLITTRMKSGGLSSKNLSSYITINKEIIKSFEINSIKINKFLILYKYHQNLCSFYFMIKKKYFLILDMKLF